MIFCIFFTEQISQYLRSDIYAYACFRRTLKFTQQKTHVIVQFPYQWGCAKEKQFLHYLVLLNKTLILKSQAQLNKKVTSGDFLVLSVLPYFLE